MWLLLDSGRYARGWISGNGSTGYSQMGHINKRVITIAPETIKLIDVNARFMRHEVFQRLVENIKEDGDLLGNTPFAWAVHDDGTKTVAPGPDGDPVYEVLSGNHRVKAAVAAKLPTITIEVTDDYLSPNRRKAIQMSHNALVGEDDPALLKTIYSAIDDVQLKIYTGLDDATLQLIENVSIASLGEANLDFQVVSMTFLPDELEWLDVIWTEARKAAAGSKAQWLVRMSDYDRALDSLEAASMATGVRNTAPALIMFLEVFSRHMGDLAEFYLDADGEAVVPSRRVPIQTIIGDNGIRSSTAAKLKKVAEKLQGRGDISSPDDVLEYLLR